MIEALICYLINVYPEAVNICKSLDTLSKYAMNGISCNDHWPESAIIEKLGSYVQAEERHRWKDNWVTVETSARAMHTIFD